MENLEQIVGRLQRDTSTITGNPVLEHFNLAKCREIDERSSMDNHIKDRRDTCLANLRNCTIDYSSYYKNAFDAYNEIVVFDLLQTKGNISWQDTGAIPSADYTWTNRNGEVINIDLKTLSYNHDNINFKDIQQQSLRSKISIEEQIAGRRPYGTSESIVYSPFKKGNNLNHYKVATVIESFIDKVQNNYKPSQLNFGGKEGILLIDTKILGHPIFMQEALPVFLSPPLNELKSGCLWNACFGKQNDPMYDWVEFKGKPNIGQPLKKNGIMTDDYAPPAIIFITYRGNETNLIGFHKSSLQSDRIGFSIYEICRFVNDEVNSKYFQLPVSPVFELTLPPMPS
ncbi:MAG: hypothetical protein J0L56_09075 [Chitinophagales bacterium]|nr:hypothetical protein [Chitinophagales bacterium]